MLHDAENTLRSILLETVGDNRTPDPAAVWQAFMAFALVPLDVSPPMRIGHDACLVQWGTYESATFELDFTRQATVEDDGAYDHMEQIHLTLQYQPCPALTRLGNGDRWSTDPLAEWFEEVEQLQPFIAAMNEKPLQVLIAQESV